MLTGKSATEIFSEMLRNDHDLAWGYHCNIVMIAIDSGADRKQAHIRTAEFMNRTWGVDTSRFEEYKGLFPETF